MTREEGTPRIRTRMPDVPQQPIIRREGHPAGTNDWPREELGGEIGWQRKVREDQRRFDQQMHNAAKELRDLGY